jgi:hypothetical protein
MFERVSLRIFAPALGLAAIVFATWQILGRQSASAPHISALVPDSAVAGSPDLVMNVAGEHFQPGASVVLWNGSPRPTQTFPGSTTLVAAMISRRDLAAPDTAWVTVIVVEAQQTWSSRAARFVIKSGV